MRVRGPSPCTVQLIAKGDMELAWQAANTVGHLATSSHSAALVAHGAVEELTYFLQVRHATRFAACGHAAPRGMCACTDKKAERTKAARA